MTARDYHDHRLDTLGMSVRRRDSPARPRAATTRIRVQPLRPHQGVADPLIPIGRPVLDRVPDNYLVCAEQAVFDPGTMVDGIGPECLDNAAAPRAVLAR